MIPTRSASIRRPPVRFRCDLILLFLFLIDLRFPRPDSEMKASKDAQRVGRKLFQATMAGGKLDGDIVRKVIKRLGDDKPRGYLGMVDAYLRLVRLEVDRNHARVESAAELSTEMKQTVTGDLRGKYGDQLTIDFATNPDLLGGMRVRVGSDVWDGSVKNRLERLSDAFG